MTERQRVPRNTLSPELIVTTALRLLDEHGVAAFGIRPLAKELGVGPMALYTYFRGKDELLDAVRDQLLAMASLTKAHGDWQHQVRTICRGVRDLILEHPCLVHLLSSRPLTGHDAADAAEALLRALAEAGFNQETAARAYTTLIGHVVGVASLEVQLAAENQDDLRTTMTSLSAQRYPTLVEHTRALGRTAGGDVQFEFGLDLLITGLESRIIVN